MICGTEDDARPLEDLNSHGGQSASGAAHRYVRGVKLRCGWDRLQDMRCPRQRCVYSVAEMGRPIFQIFVVPSIGKQQLWGSQLFASDGSHSVAIID